MQRRAVESVFNLRMRLPTLVPLLVAALAVPALAQSDFSRTVATVNGEEIKAPEYYRRMEFLPGVGKQMGGAITVFPPGFLTLEQLITEKLILQLAKKKGVLPSDLEVTNEIAARMSENPNLTKAWTDTGQTEGELRAQIRLDMAQFKVTTAGLTVTDQEIETHYAKYGDTEFTDPKKLKLRVIAVADEAGKKSVDADLAAGKAFAEVAKAKSLDGSREFGGAYGDIPITAFNPATQALVKGLAVNQNSAWIPTTSNNQSGFVKFHVDAVTPAKKQTLTPALRRTIRRKLLLGKAQGRTDVKKEMLALRAESKIDIRQKEFADAYAKFIKNFLEAEGAKKG